VVGLSNGGFAISWRDDDGSNHNDGTGVGSGYDVWMRVFDAQGGEVAGEFRVNEAHVPGSQYEPALASLSNGNFIVTWRDSDGGSHDDGTGTGSSNDVWARIFYDDGTEVVGEFRLNSYTSSSQYEPDVTALKEVGFVVTWRDDSGHDGGSGSDIRAQVHSNDGTVILPEFMVNTYTSGSQYQPTVAALDDGGFVISWTSQYQDGSNTGVYSQRFDANGTALSTIRLTGGSGDDIVTFVDAQEEMLVDLGVGNDTLSLGDKADSVRVKSVENVSLGGGDDRAVIEGADNVTINAGAGNDQVTSGDGSDTLIGGLGNDIYTVNDSGDAVIENVGEGSDTVISTADSYTLPDNVEDLRLGAGGVAATGNDLDNTITGNDDDNSLAGGAGDDLIAAGAGDDILTGGAGDDVLSGGDGEDVAFYSGDAGDYQIDLLKAQVTDINVTDGDDGTDTLGEDMEAIRFGDGGELSVSMSDDDRINTYRLSDQSQPSVTGLKDGNYVVTWADSSGHDGGSSWDIRGQIMRSDGTALGSEFRVNDYVSSTQDHPSVAALEDGDFIVTWQDASGQSGGSGNDIWAQRFDASGSATGILPGNNEITIFESCNRRMILSGGNIIVNPELRTKGGSIATHNLTADIPARSAIMTRAIRPGHNIVTVL
jgi:Ca2+-binding RTX toxin-like protein